MAMEQKIDVGVDWRMRVATPISFVEFFVGIIPIGRGIKRRTLNEIVIQTQGGNIACNIQVDSTFFVVLTLQMGVHIVLIGIPTFCRRHQFYKVPAYSDCSFSRFHGLQSSV